MCINEKLLLLLTVCSAKHTAEEWNVAARFNSLSLSLYLYVSLSLWMWVSCSCSLWKLLISITYNLLFKLISIAKLQHFCRSRPGIYQNMVATRLKHSPSESSLVSALSFALSVWNSHVETIMSSQIVFLGVWNAIWANSQIQFKCTRSRSSLALYLSISVISIALVRPFEAPSQRTS